MYILNKAFEWDTQKAASNDAKHRVSFLEAATVFADPDGLDGPDELHSGEETRYIRLGRSSTGRVLTVCYTPRVANNAETIRIISARSASRRERAAYESNAATD